MVGLCQRLRHCEGASAGRQTIRKAHAVHPVTVLLAVRRLRKNLAAVQQLADLAASKDAAVAWLALAWLLAQSDVIVPVPGTRSAERVAEKSHIRRPVSGRESRGSASAGGEEHADELMKMRTEPVQNRRIFWRRRPRGFVQESRLQVAVNRPHDGPHCSLRIHSRSDDPADGPD
ncbi:hypothetical protein F8568_022280 [Actinomadura sp. LD22]|uniref:NADP-dependent oxidoreductase domain-containing protein n=1 Tax=Actinomadura physcomitrii TaxID=2650748 RepID=A0A6I4M9L4_9ACTN|nr:hypothetical protein [Actinomadura physcomitrii]MWA03055.1 hypothetical protein [Actinomadura physcomitrii]